MRQRQRLIGGSRGVRGLEIRELSGDSGVLFRLEAHTPSIGGNHRLLGFVDCGAVWRENALPGEFSREAAAAIGAGWYWSDGKRFSARADLACAESDR